jgi:hypothetical protein
MDDDRRTITSRLWTALAALPIATGALTSLALLVAPDMAQGALLWELVWGLADVAVLFTPAVAARLWSRSRWQGVTAGNHEARAVV